MSKPISIEKPAIVEAVVEVRFTDAVPSAVAFGNLYQRLSAEMPEVETLPIQQLPAELIESQPELKYAVHYRVKNDKFMVGIGNRVISTNYICFNDKYEGWSEFREVISKVVDSFTVSALWNDIENISIRYINLFDKDLPLSKVFNLDLNIANASLGDYEDVNVGVSKKMDSDVTVKLQIGTGASLNSPQASLQGTVFNIDVIKTQNIEDIMAEFDSLHECVDDEFFKALDDSFVEELGPRYE